MIRFEEPQWLWMFAVAIPLVLFLVWESRKRIPILAHFMDDERRRLPFSQWGKGILVLGLLASITFALSNPQLVYETKRTIFESEGQVAVVFDVSRSMAAQKDINSPNRLVRSQELFLEILPRMRGAEVALFGFTDTFLSYIPFTSRHDLVRYTLEKAVGIDSLPAPGSDLGDALKGVTEKFDPQKQEKVILLFTDGESTTPEEIPARVYDKMNEAGVTLVVVGVGEAEGATIPIFNKTGEFTGLYVLSRRTGQPFTSFLDEVALVALASRAEGFYFNENEKGKLVQFFSESLVFKTITTEEKEKNSIDLYPLFIVSAFVHFTILMKRYN